MSIIFLFFFKKRKKIIEMYQYNFEICKLTLGGLFVESHRSPTLKFVTIQTLVTFYIIGKCNQTN